ncbi:MAG: D-alanyl-D-alanine carboxypeptidase/D-alanyl-D-alanine-endopeptidase [Cyanobacteriota bacterium]
MSSRHPFAMPVFLRRSPRSGVRLLLGGLALVSLAAPMAAVAEPGLPAPASVRRHRFPVAALPPLPSGLTTPVLQSQVSCPALQARLESILAGERGVWSVTMADRSGRLLADINGERPRSPASNQKLVTTAFAIDRLGPDYRLSTQMWRLPDGTFRILGQGDPDLALPHLQRFARLAMNSGGGPGLPGSVVRLELAEEPAQTWWPQGWKVGDRAYAYGAPITRLAITSNAIDEAVSNPTARLRSLMQRSVAQAGGDVRIAMVSPQTPLPQNAVLVHQEPSTSMLGLLSLANTESHNFTAEVLLRQAAGSWDLDRAARLETGWLMQQNLPMQGVTIYDGSGLDRFNRLTSRFITALLLRMDNHPYSRYFLGSMAIAGQRGTLRNLYNGTSLDGRVYAKTGTLSGVRAISGQLLTADGPRYFSAISNGGTTPNQTIGRMLRQAQDTSLCGGRYGGQEFSNSGTNFVNSY